MRPGDLRNLVDPCFLLSHSRGRWFDPSTTHHKSMAYWKTASRTDASTENSAKAGRRHRRPPATKDRKFLRVRAAKCARFSAPAHSPLGTLAEGPGKAFVRESRSEERRVG